MIEFFHVMSLPFLACLVLAGIYAYFGVHVLERQVIFVDLALAQIAVLGASVGLALGLELESGISFYLSLGFTMMGAGIFSLTRFRKEQIPQEAIIGIVYAVCAALLIVVLSHSGEGDAHIKQALVGNILLVTPKEVGSLFVVCLIVGIVHVFFRKKFFLISSSGNRAFESGINVRGWDFLFYVTFGLVVTSSVKMAGVLLVFAFLVVPAVCAMLFAKEISARLIWGWIVGVLASAMGMIVSYYWDLPTGASVVCVFGLWLVVLAAVKRFILGDRGRSPTC